MKKEQMKSKLQFDLDEALAGLKAGQSFIGKSGVLTPLIKQLSEAILEAEIQAYLETRNTTSEVTANRRNGYTSKTMKTESGPFELDTPRDRDGSFDPQFVKKYQTFLTPDIEQKMLGLFAHGMSYRDIASQIQELYGLEVSLAMISSVTDKLIPELKAWQARPLDPVYPVLWLDAIFYKVKEGSAYVHKAVYTILAMDLSGRKHILGLYLSDTEGAHFWLSVLTDLQQRGIKDILIACVDGLKGFPEAINSIYPKTEVQLCIIHQIRNSLRFVASKHHKEFMRDLKLVYRATSKQAAETALDALEATWGSRYPVVLNSWRTKWDLLSAFFTYTEDIRRIIYTTNAVEAVHRQFRKLTKTKGAFSNDTSLFKLLYAGTLNIQKKWTMPPANWNLTLSQLSINFPSRLDHVLGL